MDLSRHFQFQPKTIQLELSGGGAHGAYECGALEMLVPFWRQRGFKIDIVTGVSAGAVNAVLLSAALNSGKDVSNIMGGFWDKVAVKGDTYLAPFLDLHSLTNTFNFFASPADQFPNIPRYLMATMKLGGKSRLPLTELKMLLEEHLNKDDWEAVRNGPTETFVGTVHVTKTGEKKSVLFTGDQLSSRTVLASAALRDFAPYRIDGEHYEDGGYDKIGFFLKDHERDVLFAIGLKPLKNATELEDHRGVKTGQLHHDLARYHLDPERKCTIDFLCMDHPSYWNETSAMNNTSRNIDALRKMGQADALKWIKDHGCTFGKVSSFKPSQALLNAIAPPPSLEAA